MNRKPYPKYLNSNVQWIGQVPEHWEVKRLKYSASINDEVLSETTDPDFEFNYVDIGSVSPLEGLTNTECMIFENAPSRARRKVKRGDTIVSTVRTYLRAIAPISDTTKPLVVSTGFAVVRPRKLNPSYLAYALRESSFIENVVARSTGVSYPAVNASEVGDIAITLPPLSEQCAIADFLDRETGRIDALMAKKRELMALLKEKRSALITRTVTRGLPADASREFGLEPHTRYKYSGIQWLGQVPDEWEVKRGRFVMWVNPPAPLLRNLEKDREVSFVPMDSINEYGGIRHEQTRVKAEVGGGYTEFQNGDVVIAKITPCFENGKGTIANGLVNSAAYGTTELHVLRASHTLEIRFLFYLTITDGYRKLGESEMYGAGGQKRVPPEFCKDFLTPIPPLPEQAAIAAYLDRETARIDRLVEKIESVVERLQEYRTALITAVVTGKIDVRKTA